MGDSELIVREVIPNHFKYETIYNGMPLREEIRVFYNMNTDKIEYMVDYWDYDYCYENLRNKTDEIIFDWFHNKFEGTKARQELHRKILEKVMKRIEEDMSTLKFDKSFFKGIWSIDFLYEKYEDKIYLIDMARGFRSAYWDENRIRREG